MINQVYTLRSAFEPATDCSDGDILLYDGTKLSTEHSNGTVLVCLDNEYGTVCDDFWDVLDAMVVCRYLGFESAGICFLKFSVDCYINAYCVMCLNCHKVNNPEKYDTGCLTSD